MRKVGYDGQAFLSSNGGTGKGAQLRTLLGPYLGTFTGFASRDPNTSGLPLVQGGVAGYNLWQQLNLPGLLRRHRIEVFLAPSNTAPLRLPRSLTLLLVLHDMIIMKDFRRPTRRERLLDLYRRRLIPASVARAQIVITGSEYARDEILDAFPRATVQIVPCTVSHEWFAARPLERRSGHLLMVTSSAPHKNADAAIRAYLLYARRAGSGARPLRIVGMGTKGGLYAPMLQAAGMESRVSFLPYLQESELRQEYLNAAAMMFPSLDEGFGIPVLEAMATGTPLVASRRASLPEIAADAACYFDPLSIEEMAASLEAVLGDSALAGGMAARGLQRVGHFHPDVVREKVLALWRQAAGVTP